MLVDQQHPLYDNEQSLRAKKDASGGHVHVKDAAVSKDALTAKLAGLTLPKLTDDPGQAPIDRRMRRVSPESRPPTRVSTSSDDGSEAAAPDAAPAATPESMEEMVLRLARECSGAAGIRAPSREDLFGPALRRGRSEAPRFVDDERIPLSSDEVVDDDDDAAPQIDEFFLTPPPTSSVKRKRSPPRPRLRAWEAPEGSMRAEDAAAAYHDAAKRRKDARKARRLLEGELGDALRSRDPPGAVHALTKSDDESTSDEEDDPHALFVYSLWSL